MVGAQRHFVCILLLDLHDTPIRVVNALIGLIPNHPLKGWS